jgi:large subunit ribosomal protein L15
MQLHDIIRTSSRQVSKRVGRGGKRGKTSGKGHKGQKARTGNSTRPNVRDVIKKIPKLRGHGKNRGRTVNSSDIKHFPVNISVLEMHFDGGDTINPMNLRAKKLIPALHNRPFRVKILGTGNLTKKFVIEQCILSKSAEEKIESLGGSIQRS